mmetsp:Transcript_55836/g.110938  ORF Transcript_55836/g.110938 Transcript_55836/m.110938 type:complete len:121 (-) Transcript_55836:1409-1771(-)
MHRFVPAARPFLLFSHVDHYKTYKAEESEYPETEGYAPCGAGKIGQVHKMPHVSHEQADAGYNMDYAALCSRRTKMKQKHTQDIVQEGQPSKGFSGPAGEHHEAKRDLNHAEQHMKHWKE